MHELLAVGVEFPDLGMVKIEPDHPAPDVDSLIARLNDRHSSNWDVPHLRQYIEENEVADYIRTTSIDPTTAAGVVPSRRWMSHRLQSEWSLRHRQLQLFRRRRCLRCLRPTNRRGSLFLL